MICQTKFPYANTFLSANEAARHVTHTRCHHESQVEQRFRQKSLDVFLPCFTVVRQWWDRKKILKVLLFPGSLFVHDTLEASMYFDTIKLPGVVQILGNKAVYIKVPPENIEHLKLMVASDRPYYPHRSLMRRKRVRVVEGPLAGVIGLMREEKEKKRKVIIEVEIFHRAVAVGTGI